jgi:protocatechuate 3,4-dioxygenase beta subunit
LAETWTPEVEMTIQTRREALAILGAAGTAMAVGCGGEGTADPDPVASAPTNPGTSGACAVAPNETEGPYPSITDFMRSDIREGSAGTPVTLTLTVVSVGGGCGAVSGALVHIWQCDAQGRYSEYSQPGYDGRAATYLRGMQTTDAAGRVTFTTVYPGWYAGRATHIHVDVLVNGRSVKVTQIAFPESVTAAVYATGVYAAKGQNPTRNTGDMVFADSVASELATVSGDPASGFAAAFTIGIA